MQVWYGGKSHEEVNVQRLVGYVGQNDSHFPLLTVRETFDFALTCLLDERKLPAEVQAEVGKRVETAIRHLGLSNAADTILGDDLLRGVSGGERKRVTTGEMLMGAFRCFFFGARPSTSPALTRPLWIVY